MRRRDLLLCALLLCSIALPGARLPAAAGHGGDAPGSAGAVRPETAAAGGQPAGTVTASPATAAIVDPVAPVASVSAVPPDTDLLLALPPAGVAPAALAAALARRGYEPLPALPLLPAVRVRVPVGADPDEVARELAATGLLAGVEPDARVRAGRLPDDPLLVTQQAYLEAVRAPAAWEVATGSEHVLVAVVDSGIDATHADLATRLFVNHGERPDGRDDDGNGCADDTFGCTFVSPEAADPACGYTQPAPRPDARDDEGHGTFVAGIAAAAGDNGVGGSGLAWVVRILPVKVLDCTATGRISEAAAGIRYAAHSGARVIVVAFGAPADSRVLREAVAEATAGGALVVASVGNEGHGRVQFPAAYPGVLAVAGSGATRADGSVDYRLPAPFSNFGPEVSLYAPAVRLVAPLPLALCGERGWSCLDDQPYARASGTSFAAPLAAGAAALLFARDPGLPPALALALLRGRTHPLADGLPGPGLLDVAAALGGAFASGAPGTSHGFTGAPPAGPAVDPPLHQR